MTTKRRRSAMAVETRFYEAAEVALMLGLSPEYVRELAQDNQIPCKILQRKGSSRRIYRFYKGTFERWMADGGVDNIIEIQQAG